MSWTNDDGLYVRFGTEKPEVARGGESSTDGMHRTLTIDLDWDKLGTTGTAKVLDGMIIPDGAVLKEATINVSTAFTSGGSATLQIGLIDTDRSTVYDSDGVDAAIAVASLTAGTEINCNGSAIGKLISNSGTDVMLTTLVGTAAFTAGKGKLEVVYYIP